MSTAALRRLRPGLLADIRGIALQTVVIIVVMLVIAGGVAAVLTSRGSDVIGELQATDINPTEINSLDECTNAFRGLTGQAGVATVSASGADTATWTAPNGPCEVRGQTGGNDRFNAPACELWRGPSGQRGVFTNAGATETCTLT